MASTPFSPPLPENTPDALMRKVVTRKIAWRIVPLLAFAYFMANIERLNLGIASLSMNKSLGLTETAFGLAAGLYFLGYFVAEVPSNLALTRVGARKWFARIALSWGVVAAATAFVQNDWSLDIMRILLGLAEAGLFPGVAFFFTLWFPVRDRAKMLVWFTTGGTLSAVLGPPVSGAILTFWPKGLFGLDDWRALFILEGLPSIIVGVLIWKFLVDSPNKAKWLSTAEKSWLAGQLEEPGHLTGGNPLKAMLNPRVLILSIAYFAKSCGGYVLIFFMPIIIKTLTSNHGIQYSTMTISLLSTIPAIFGMIAPILWAIHSDRKQERQWHAALPMIVGAGGIAWAAVTSDPIVLLVALTIATMGINSIGGAFFQLPGVFLTGPAVAVGVAAINATGNLGGFVGPYLFGFLKDATNSFAAGNTILAVLLLIGAGLILLPVFRPRPDRLDLRPIAEKSIASSR